MRSMLLFAALSLILLGCGPTDQPKHSGGPGAGGATNETRSGTAPPATGKGSGTGTETTGTGANGTGTPANP
jgi:hypothetical protein